ncbi:MAG: acyl-CoA thioesterase/bile acid-CoA:amino acid N-acyltransferase family protein [Actinomycetota bacterium]
MAELKPTIEVTPVGALADEPVSISITGLPPGRQVSVTASTRDDSGQRWESRAECTSDEAGALDLDTAGSTGGTYIGPDGAGLFWSMTPVSEKDAHPFAKQTTEQLALDLSVELDGTVAASRRIERPYLAAGAESVPLSDEGLVGTYLKPAGEGPFPGVLLLHGTVKRMLVDYGALLASRGFAALALQYFGAEGLPPELVEIPLEYFGRAIEWMRARPEVDGKRIAVQGVSRGGELALLVGSNFEQVKAVVSIAGSGVVFQGLLEDRRDGSVRAAWTRGGEPVGFVTRRDSLGFTFHAVWAGFTGGTFSTLSSYSGGMDDGEAVAKATIPVEKIRGPVLMASGSGDMMWPYEACSRISADRLASLGHEYPVELLVYQDAGHGLGLPYRPTTLGYIPATERSRLALGGSPAGNAAASADMWPKVLDFYSRWAGT